MEVVSEKQRKQTLPEGFKWSEVGMIPIDWEISNLGEKCQIFGRIGYRGYTKSDIVEKEKGAIALSPSNIVNGKMDFSNVTYISWFKYQESPEIKIRGGDILLVKTGSSYGKSAIIRVLDHKSTINPQLIVLKNITCDYRYLGYLVGFKTVQNQIDSKVVGGAIPTLSQKQVSNFKIPVPPTLEEQRAIADALSDVDALITELDALIEKKQQIKQGTMQQLLTGKKRLPGFSGEWALKTFDECFQFLQSGTNSRNDLSGNGEIGYIHYGDIHAKWSDVLDCDKATIPKIQKNKVNHLPYLEEGDLILADASEDYEGLGAGIEINNLNDRRIVAGLHTILLRAKNGCIANGYKAHITKINPVKKSLREIATGTTVLGISKSKLKQINILLPPNLEEQKAIATILSAMDAEIQSLQKKRDKYKQIKQGMMQELLTGKTRLI